MKKLSLLILSLLLLFSACAPASSEISRPPSVEHIESTPKPTVEPEPEPITNPLSGETIDEDISSKRPYAIMINNISVAQPHCGVSGADIIYEVLAEGDITRMLAIYSDLENVGPIGSMRSSRPYYIELAMSYDAIYVHAGGSEQAYSDIASKGVNNIDGVRGAYADDIFYRDSSRQKYGTEHSLFTSSEKLLEYTPTLGYSPEHNSNYNYGLLFTDEPTMGDSAAIASSVNVSFSGLKNTDFTFHPDTGLYTGRQFGNDYIDGNTDETIGFKNLLVLFADTQIIDNDGRRTVDLVGSGEGYFICGGLSIPICWTRSGSGAPFIYAREDGSELELGVGKSYIAIVPTESEITME